MSVTRRVILLAVAVVVGFVVYHSVTPWGWSAQLQTPATVAPQYVTYTCGALWESASVHGPEKTAYPVEGTPCGTRRSYQVITAVDVLLGVFAIAFVLAWKRTRNPSLT